MNGFLNILKPPGMTSAAVVGYVRRMTGEKRVGHAGTLDPEAAGVLPIMIGRAARLFDYLVDKEKTYVAECAFGAATDTQDATGKIIATGENYPDFSAVQEAAKHLVGDIEQRPSIFSAIKQDGKPLYERARDGACELEYLIKHLNRRIGNPGIPRRQSHYQHTHQRAYRRANHAARHGDKRIHSV